MKIRFLLLAASLAWASFACSSSSRQNVGGVQQRADRPSPSYVGFHGHILPPVTSVRTTATAKIAAAAGDPGTLVYYGGKVISGAQIYNIYWGSAGSYQPQLDQFAQTVPPGPYMAWLNEYDTPTQNIGPGSFAGSLVDTSAPTGTTVDDTQIQSELLALVAAGKLPPPAGNELYLFFFPEGVNVTASGVGSSCTDFCGYHETFVSGASEFYYGVLPDPATCGSGCDNQSGNYFADLTSVTTHEITEAVTDPEVGIAIQNSELEGGTYPTFPNGWTSASGEIGDLCAWQNATVSGYNVQLEWSNAQNGCVAGGATGDDGGNGEGGGDDGGAEASQNQFALSLFDASLIVTPGSSASTTVTTTLVSGNVESVVLSTSGLPAGVTAAFNPSTITSGGDSATLTFAVDPGAPPASAVVTVTGVTPSTAQTATLVLTVAATTAEAGVGCDHAICTPGDALNSACDPCAAQVCVSDSYCCSVAWDSICVSEVGSYCGNPCP